MYEGKSCVVDTEGLNEEKLGLYMLGLERHSEGNERMGGDPGDEQGAVI